MATDRMWLLHQDSGWAARLATSYDYGWDCLPDSESLDDLFGKSPKAQELQAAGDYEVPSREDVFIAIWEGDGRNWKYGDPHPTLKIRKIYYTP